MQSFAARIAVVTGAGSGIGRALTRALAAEGCSVAACDLSVESLAETVSLSVADKPPPGVRLTTHTADVASEGDLQRVRDEVIASHATDCIHLLFNNAGVGGGASFVTDPREAWERTFAIDWGGVYLGVRTFLPLLMAADAGHIVNTSSVASFWAATSPKHPNTAYATAKFAVRGFTEALISDLRVNAPHIGCSVVMPGHVGTGLVANSRRLHGGVSGSTLTRDLGADAEAKAAEIARRFEAGGTRPEEAAAIILAGVKAGRWRILVGADAEDIDRRVRADPEAVYEAGFLKR